MSPAQVTVTGLALAVIASAMGVVYAQHETRKLFIELRALQGKHQRMEVEWGQLQLEQSTWATHGRIEKLARKKLGMRIPGPGEVVVITP